MISGDIQQPLKSIIPPTHQSVKAGFVVYSPKSESRCITILEEGELVARETEPPYSVVFTMRPGDLVGVAALLEREPFKYELSASKDSRITVVTEESMESELKTLPLWLLALLRSLSSKTHQLKRSAIETRVQNTLKSLAEYLSHKPQKVEFNLAELIREFSWLTKIPTVTVQEDVKSLLRRHLVKISQKDGRIFCAVLSTTLLKILVDYLEQGDGFIPYKLTITQKKILVFISTLEKDACKNSPEWIALIQDKFKDADIGQWFNLLKLGWFKPIDDGNEGLYAIDSERVRYILKALRYETNIRGVL